jgi:transposase InsO family protein
MERDRGVIEVLNEIVARKPRWGFWKLYDRLRLDGQCINRKRLHRVYCAMKLNLPRRTKRRLPTRIRQPLAAPAGLNQIWALDFMADALYSGRAFRTLNLIDEGNRQVLGIEVAHSIPSLRVIRVMEQLIELHGKPERCAWAMGPSSPQLPSPNGARAAASKPGLSNRENRTRTRSSSASTKPIGTKCSMPTCSKASSRCARSPRPGYTNTTSSGRMTASAVCRP